MLNALRSAALKKCVYLKHTIPHVYLITKRFLVMYAEPPINILWKTLPHTHQKKEKPAFDYLDSV